MKLPAIATATGIAITAAFVALPAEAKGIDCAKAATALEKTICGDKKLLRADEDMAINYDIALKAYDGKIADYVRRDQMRWRRDFVAIGKPVGEIEPLCDIKDKACILAVMTRRADDLGSGTFQNSGIYKAADGRKLLMYPAHGNGYSVRLHIPGGETIRSLDQERAALWDGPDFMVAQMGDGSGLPLPNPMGGPDPDGCELRMLPKLMSIQVWQKGYCSGKNFAGMYQRQMAELLADYEVSVD